MLHINEHDFKFYKQADGSITVTYNAWILFRAFKHGYVKVISPDAPAEMMNKGLWKFEGMVQRGEL